MADRCSVGIAAVAVLTSGRIRSSAAHDYEGSPARGLSLPEPIVRKIFRDNARRWLPGVGV